MTDVATVEIVAEDLDLDDLIVGHINGLDMMLRALEQMALEIF